MNKDKKIAIIISSLMFVCGIACGTVITGIGHTEDNSVTVSADDSVSHTVTKAATKSKVIELPPIQFTRSSSVSTSPSVSLSAPIITSTPVSASAPKTTSAPVSASAPKATSAPVSTSAPKVTSAPVSTSAPKVTSAPVSTSAPKVTSAPVTSTNIQLKMNYDVNGDGKINIMDIMYLKQYVLKAGK